jgi:hypothetical protein
MGMVVESWPWMQCRTDPAICRLIAIMLGRLEMDVDECIAAYIRLMEAVFKTKKTRFPITRTGNLKAQFDSAKLEAAITEVIRDQGAKETDLFNDGTSRRCRV